MSKNESSVRMKKKKGARVEVHREKEGGWSRGEGRRWSRGLPEKKSGLRSENDRNRGEKGNKKNKNLSKASNGFYLFILAPKV